jgi:hypothetical protein
MAVGRRRYTPCSSSSVYSDELFMSPEQQKNTGAEEEILGARVLAL